MGLFDGLINAFIYGLGIKKKIPPDYHDTNEVEFLDLIPDDQIFVFLSSARKLERSWTGFMRGGIQGASKSYWIHAGLGYKKDGKVEIIESLDKITRRELKVYFKPVNQLKLFFPPLTKKQSLEIWKKAINKVGDDYDYLEIVDHVSIIGKIFSFRWGDPKKFVCASFVRWIFNNFFIVINPKIKKQLGTAGDINNWLQPLPDVGLLVYNMSKSQYN